MAATPEGGN